MTQENQKPKGILNSRKAVVVAVAGLLGLFLMSIDHFWPEDASKKVSQPLTQTGEAQNNILRGNDLAAQEKIMESRLENVLSKMAGVGKVQVRVTLAQGIQSDYAINTNTSNRQIEEKDKQGGVRQTTEQTNNGNLVLMKSTGTSREEPVVVREVKPIIGGILVVAEGAKDPKIKENINKAVSTLLDVPAHKVNVQPKEVEQG